MPTRRLRNGGTNPLYVLSLSSLVVLSVLTYLLMRSTDTRQVAAGTSNGAGANDDGTGQQLFMYCAAGMRYPMEDIVAAYQDAYGVSVQLQYGGSNTLLNQLEVARTGDLYLAADDSYMQLAQQKGLIAERIPLARMRPVIAVQAGNPKKIGSIRDLTREDVSLAIGDPGAAAVGKATRRLLSATGDWEALSKNVKVQTPTVNEIANAVLLGSVDAGIIWDSTAAQYDELLAISTPELDAGRADIEVAIVSTSKQPTTALRFARYVAARDQGLKTFAARGFAPVEGDVWSQVPELTLFAGAVNRRALEPAIREFEQREGVTINTVFDGCGSLTARMRTIHQNSESGFPDTYMACDVYYLNTVKDWFQDSVNVSDTDIVIAVQKGNPKNIQSLADLLQPGTRVVMGQPDQCTIGVLSRRMLQSEGIYQPLIDSGNIVAQKPTSAMLIPSITARHADAALAYRTDAQSERARLDVIEIDLELAKAIQPFSIARGSDCKFLSRRLFDQIAKSRDAFEAAGFNWRLDDAKELSNNQKAVAPVATDRN